MSNFTSNLHPVFLDRMKTMLGDEYDSFVESYEQPRTYGLRVNTSKISCEDFEKIVPFEVRPIPWISNGYFYNINNEETRPSHCPLYQAGLYYLQDPSAMTPASRLPVKPGEYVLDMCAAPGGKATAVGAALEGKGLLVANDISASRVKALLRNLELFGVSNVFLANEPPAKLVEKCPEFFHKIILDAPCSGEGMFRKEEALAHDWTPKKSAELAIIQKDLISHAASMLRPGGLLMYSTCTFSPAEDEEIISIFLEEHPEFSLLAIENYEGFTSGNPDWGNGNPDLVKCVRIFPHKMQGEGHFLALLKKEGEAADYTTSPKCNLDKNSRKWIGAFLDEIGLQTLGGQVFDWNRVELRKDKVYYLPAADTSCFRGLTFLRNGLYLGDLKKNRFEPSQPFALALHRNDVQATISLSVSDERLTRYLKGETLLIQDKEATNTKGWHVLCIEGYPLGFGKLVNNTFKNKYPAGWRIMG